MPRRKVPVEVREVTIVAIVWQDAQIRMREKVSADDHVLITYGALVHEDERKITISHEHEFETTFMQNEQDWTSIPKAVILKRHVIGTLRIEDDE